MEKKLASINFEGKEYSIETGRFAKFANGAVMVKCGDTMVLVTAVAANEEKPDVDFLPLSVEYREKYSAVGKIPGGFLKREGRPTDNEVLNARLIDRPIRPMLPKNWRYETQIIAQVFSAEPDVDPDTLAAVGASAALLISDIPFAGPISEVRVGRLNGEFISNPSFEQLKQCDIDITIAGTDTDITMVEGESKEISEDDFLAALEYGHKKIKELNALQNQLAAQCEIVKREIITEEIPSEIVELVINEIKDDINEFVHKVTSKAERSETRHNIEEKAKAKANEVFGDKEEYSPKLEKWVSEVVNDYEKKQMRKMIIEEKKRLDGRGLSDIRPITCEVGLLPRTHGSALFTRGETQSLTSVTLGTQKDAQTIDGLDPVYQQRFILHYNFPPFSTGEVGRLGTSRREIGHGHLAWRALKELLPDEESFPYAIRIISDILESNGSSSMATVCAGSLGLFDAGVPMKKPVAGIAMGLIKEGDNVAVLSDILGDEDHLGDMDFKVTGTADGITACQMDIKIQGISIEIMKQALEQARAGRIHILGIMNATIDKPREDISQYAPRFFKIKIPTDTIGLVIGTGGETIRSITTQTQTEIVIEQDGTVIISSPNLDYAQAAKEIIEKLIRKPQVGEVYTGEVKEIRPNLGAFVEFLPKQQGLLHISQIAKERVNEIGDYLKIGDKIEVKLIEITSDGKYRLSLRAMDPDYVEEPERHRPRNDRNRRSNDERNSGERGHRR
ncbi:MAG: polyribonucleotide nucleotidyltransferase [Candidatus Kapaibacteriota bacterium]